MTDREPNWDLLLDSEIESVIGQAARQVAHSLEWGEYVEEEDLLQEATLLVVGPHQDYAAQCLMGEDGHTLGGLQERLRRKLVNFAEREKFRKAKHSSVEERYTESNEDGVVPAYAPYEGAVQYPALYDRTLVEALLPAVWDQDFAYGMQQDHAPDADMPRGTVNKAKGNVLWAHLADIRISWERAPLTAEERRVLLLAYGFDWTQRDIAYNQQCSQPTVSNRIYTGVGKILAELNGGDFAEFFTGAAA